MEQTNEDFEKARANKDIDPAGYCWALILRMNALRAARDYLKAEECFEESMVHYRQNAKAIHLTRHWQGLWNFLRTFSVADTADERMFQLLNIAGSSESCRLDEIHNLIQRFVRERDIALIHRRSDLGPSTAEERSQNQKDLWSKIIADLAAFRGQDNPGLAAFYESYALVCEGCKSLEEAEQAFLRAAALMSHEDDVNKVARRVRLAKFHIRQKRFDRVDELWATVEPLRDSKPISFIDILIDIASTYCQQQDYDLALVCYLQVLEIYKTNIEQFRDTNVHDRLWHFIGTSAPVESFEERLFELLNIAENERIPELAELDRLISHAFSNRRSRLSHGPQGKPLIAENIRAEQDRDLWKKIIELRSRIRGDADPGLSLLLEQYASACEACHDLVDAENALVRSNAVASNPNTGDAARRQVSLAMFYLRNKMYDQASSCSRSALELTKDGIDLWSARSLSTLVEYYEKNGRPREVEKLMEEMLDRGGEDVAGAVDSRLQSWCNKLCAAGSFEKAEFWIKRRLKATDSCSSDQDANEWRLKLSDLYLALNRQQESDELYRLVIASVALTGKRTDMIRLQRASLLERLGRGGDAEEIYDALPDKNARPILIKFGFLAKSEIQLKNFSNISVVDSRRHGHQLSRGADPGICCLGTTVLGANVVLGCGVYGNVSPPEIQRSRRLPGHIIGKPIPTGLKPFPSAPSCPPPDEVGSRKKGNFPDVQARLLKTLHPVAPGDYSLTFIPKGISCPPRNGKVRIFLRDEEVCEPAIEARGSDHARSKPQDLQIFYNGNRTLRLRELTGVVYAPNATVEIPLNSKFCGVIVAERIIAEGNNKILLDNALIDLQLFP